MKKKFKFKKRYIAYSLIVSYIIMCQSCMTMRMTSKETKEYFAKSETDFVDKTIEFDNHKIHYLQTGNPDNPTLFFVHGSPGSWDAYKEYLKDTLLLKQFRMIAVDRPGFGYSNFGEAQDLATQSQWLTTFFKKVDNGKPTTLIGHSLGGPAIVKMAVDNPNLYENLVILAGSVDPNAETPENWRPVLKSVPLRYLIPGALRPSNDELWWLKQDLMDMKPNLKNVVSDIIIIHGTKDRLVPYSNVAFMEKEFVNAKSISIIAIENADHFIPWTNLKMIRDELLKLK